MPLRSLVSRRVAPGTGCALVVTALLAAALCGRPIAGASSPGALVVHVAADRDLVTGEPIPLAGVSARAVADADPAAVAGACVTDAAGRCTIDGLVPGTYRVSVTAGPPGAAFSPITTLTTSADGDVPYAEVVEVGEGVPSTRRFVLRRANPPLPERCDARVTLLYDLSGSIAPHEAAAMRAASLAFVDALAGTLASIAIASFATSAPAAGNTNLPPTPLRTPGGVAAVHAAVAALRAAAEPHDATNWDAAFRSVDATSDAVVMFTDGNPTTHGLGPGDGPVVTGFEEIEAGVRSANARKAAGTRVIAVGVGDPEDLSPANLRAISGPVEGSDYAITTFARVHEVFGRLTDELCGRSPGPPVRAEPGMVEREVEPVIPRFTG